MSSHGHEDGDMPGAERDGPPTGVPDLPLAAGMLRRQVRRGRDSRLTAERLICEGTEGKRHN